MSGIDKSSEYTFYYSCLHNAALVREMNDYDKSLFQALKQKVAHYGIEGLNKTGFGPNRTILNKSEQPRNVVGKQMDNPLIFSSKEEAVAEIPKIYKNQLIKNPTIDDLKPVKGKAGYYFWDTGQGPAYILAYKPPATATKEKPVTLSQPASTSLPMPKKTTTTYTGVKKTKDLTTPKPKLRSEYDLLFNSLDYQTSYDAEIKEMAMDLIFAGDDLLDNFNYESIDYLPDYDIDIKEKQ